MARITLLICDHCDVRDPADGPQVPVHSIKSVDISLVTDCVQEPIMQVHLCVGCRKDLRAAITFHTTQRPCAAPTKQKAL